MPWSSPSALDRGIGCPAACVLPRTKEDKESQAAAWGHEVHAWKEGKPATVRVQRWLDYGGWDESIRATLWPGGEHEVILFSDEAGNVTRVPELEKERPQWSMAYIMDWVSEDGLVPHIDDLKTGRAPPASSTQNWAYAWAFFRYRPYATRLIVSCTHWPRYPKGQPPERVKTEVLDREQVMAWWSGVVIPARRLAQGPLAPYDFRPDPVPDGMTLATKWPKANGYCRWCRSKELCPEMVVHTED